MKKLILVLTLAFAGATVIPPLASPAQAAPVKTKIAVLTIDGMTCSGCAHGVSGMLERIAGVQRAEINLQKKTATVRYDASRASLSAMKKSIEEAGFKVRRMQSRAA